MAHLGANRGTARFVPARVPHSCSPGGIGNALAREFHVRGLRVFATARTLSNISELEELGMDTLQLDVTDAESVEACAAQVEKMLGGKGLDYLVNNAGICRLLAQNNSRVPLRLYGKDTFILSAKGDTGVATSDRVLMRRGQAT